ncbi:hypothetical protein [Orientia tsutsugamushi]
MLINKGIKPFQEFITPEHFKNRSLSKLVKVVQNYKCQRSN